MLIMLFIFILMPSTTVASQCEATDIFSVGSRNYSLFSSCNLPYNDATADCQSRHMQVVMLKTTDELNFLSKNIVRLGLDNSLFWVANVCPAIAVLPDNPSLCIMMTANVTVNATNNMTTSYVQLTFSCDAKIGWICEGTSDAHPCPVTTPSPTTATTTITTLTSPTIMAATTSTATSTSSTTVRLSTSSSFTSTSTTSPTTTITSTVTDLPSECTRPLENQLGSNLYHVFDQCYRSLDRASSVCKSHNSSLAILVSQQEMTYLANLTAQHKLGSWSYWLGGLTETGNCTMLMVSQSLSTSHQLTRYRISMGYQCTEEHPFVCKTFTDTMAIKLNLHRSDSPQGSVMDHRPTAIFLGSVGIGVLVLIVIVVVVIDMPNLVSDVRRAKRRVGRFRTHKLSTKSDVIKVKNEQPIIVQERQTHDEPSD